MGGGKWGELYRRRKQPTPSAGGKREHNLPADLEVDQGPGYVGVCH